MTTTRYENTIADALGIDPGEIKTVRPKWEGLLREGVLVNVHVGRWRAKASLSLSDLGLYLDKDESNAFDEYMKLGDKYLLPARYIKLLASVDAGVRQNIKKHSLETYWGDFVTYLDYPEWKSDFEAYKARYEEIAAEIVENWPEILAETIDGHAMAARQAYRRAKLLDPAMMGDREYDAEDVFVDRYIAGIEKLIPTLGYVRDSFSLSADLRYVPLPEIMAEETAASQLAAEKSRVERENIRADGRVYQEARGLEEQEIHLKAVKARDAATQRIEMLSQMNREVVAQAQAKREEQIDGFIADVQRTISSQLYQMVSDISSDIGDRGYLHPRKVTALKNMLKKVSNLAQFSGDETVDKMIATVSSELDKKADGRDVGEIKNRLGDIEILTRQTLTRLGDSDRGQRTLNLPPAPTAFQVKQARRNLNLDPAPAPVEIKRRAKKSNLKMELVLA